MANSIHQAIQVIRDKIDHYSNTGNARKLDIYKRKLDDKNKILLAIDTAKTLLTDGGKTNARA